MKELVLSCFPGIGLFDRAFAASFCVVQLPDKITGGNICETVGVPGRINGIIAGPPCQGFSVANSHRKNPNHPSVVNSRRMLQETCRIVSEFQPEWFVVENVPCVPDVKIDGYSVQRIPLTDRECGGVQLRSRHFQFGSRFGQIIRPERVNDEPRNRKKGRPSKAVTTKPGKWVDFPDLCRSQGLDKPIELPGWTMSAKKRAVANGVPLRMGSSIAAAILLRALPVSTDCQCGCGRIVSERALTATPACRQRKRKQLRCWVDVDGYHET